MGRLVHRPVVRLWPGETCVILASGPSLCAEDVDYVRGKARVICVNDSWRLAPWADVLYATDGRWWDHHRGVPDFNGLKFGLTVEPRRWPDVQVLRNDGPLGICIDPTGVRTGKNSGAAAINLAVHCGVSRILLLGYDMGHAPGTASHFFGEHDHALLRHSPYAVFRASFDALVAPLKAINVDVVNCTRGGFLEAFPRANLVDALSERREAVA